MKAIVPAAGQGTRLYPQTHTKPKPMVRLAGKPILGHILNDFVASPVDEVVIVVGVMRDLVIDYATEHFGSALNLTFAVQEQPEGLGHCIYQARDDTRGDSVCIALGDMLFESGYADYIAAHRKLSGVDGSLGVKRVSDPSNYGVVSVDDDRITKLEEKPPDPATDLAISGVYLIDDTSLLFECLEYLLEQKVLGSGDEYQLTDALQLMIDRDATLGTFDVRDWYDCGRPETLLEANRILLDRADRDVHTETEVSRIIPPVDIGEDVELVRSVIGPHVSIDDETRIVDSRVRNSIVGKQSSLSDVNVSQTIIGNRSSVSASPNQLNVGDSSEVGL